MDSKVKITFFGGVNEIGGNITLIEDFGYDVKLFLDFGINFEKYYKIFDYENPISVEELTRTHLLPREENITFSIMSGKITDKRLMSVKEKLTLQRILMEY